VLISIYDHSGQLVRELRSQAEPTRDEPPPEVPNYWLYHPTPLPTNAGMNRYVWDLRYPAPDAIRHTYPIGALYEATHAEPQGPFVVPGQYEVRLTIGDQTYKQPLTVEMDPRVKVTQAEMEQQLDFAKKIDELMSVSYDLHENAANFLGEITSRQAELEKNAPNGAALPAIKEFHTKALSIQGEQQRGFGGGGKPKPTFTLMNSQLANLAETVNMADAAPTAAMRTAYHDYCQDLTKLAHQWSDLLSQNQAPLRDALIAEHVQPLPGIVGIRVVPACGP